MLNLINFKNLPFLLILLFAGLVVLKVESRGVSIKSGSQLLWILGLTLVSVLLTSTGETFAAKFLSLQAVVLFIVGSSVFYSLSLAVNSARGTEVIPFVFIAFIWNAMNTVVTTLFGLIIDPRFAKLSFLDKGVFAVIVVILLSASALIFYLNTKIAKVTIE